MHPFSKLRCDKCHITFSPELCYMSTHDCRTCYANVHECYRCRSPACFSTLSNEEREDFLQFVHQIAEFHGESVMEEISRGMTSKWWFELDHPTIEACLNTLPHDETRVRTYLEHVYCQIYEEIVYYDH